MSASQILQLVIAVLGAIGAAAAHVRINTAKKGRRRTVNQADPNNRSKQP